jgi:FkbM family methyltransferase
MRKLHWSLLKRFYSLRRRYAVYDRLGQAWLLDNTNWVDQQLIIRRPYEVKQLSKCSELVRRKGITHFIDAGANIGLYSVLLASEFKQLKVYAFEPLPRNADQLSANLLLNGLSERVAVYRCALSDQTGMTELLVDERSTGTGTIMGKAHAGKRLGSSRPIIIQTSLLDDLLDLSGQRVLMKIDVEGAELKVLAGMKRFLELNEVSMQVEVFDRQRHEVRQALEALGYHQTDEIGADLYFENRQS